MDDNSQIYSLALQCHQIFLEHVTEDSPVQATPFARMSRECHYRFNSWTAYLGVFAAESASLDSRLKDAVDVKELVLQILDSIKDNLQLSLELLRHRSSLPINSTPASSESWKHPQIQTSILRSIDRLERLGVAIRRSSTVGFQQRVEAFTKKRAKTSFEELSPQIVQSMYPDADNDLVSYLGRSIFLRYARLRYKDEHQKKLARPRYQFSESEVIGKAPAEPVVKPTEAKASTRPDEVRLIESEDTPEITKVGNVSNPTLSDTLPSTFQGGPEFPRGPSQKTSSILARGASYPKPPKKEDAPGFKTCGWCFELYETVRFEDTKWWRRHVDRDLLPYLCLSEECAEKMPQFGKFEQWKGHMEENHSAQWAEKVYARIWVCDIDHEKPLDFKSLQQIKNHMHGSHGDIFDDVQIKVLAEESAVREPRPVGVCPLCCLIVGEDEQDEQDDGESRQSENENFLAEHTVRKVNAVPSKKTQKKKVSFNIPPQQSPLATSSGDSDDSPTIPHKRTSDKSTLMKVALHVAKHLQTLSFFSLRLKALEEQEHLDSEENRDYESQGAPTIVTDSGNDSRLGDFEFQDALTFTTDSEDDDRPEDFEFREVLAFEPGLRDNSMLGVRSLQDSVAIDTAGSGSYIQRAPTYTTDLENDDRPENFKFRGALNKTTDSTIQESSMIYDTRDQSNLGLLPWDPQLTFNSADLLYLSDGRRRSSESMITHADSDLGRR